ncbi:DUF4430 domain-containing protein [Candidatus Saccharibacteria bacterium]|nr:MAG: DUF4430 domain-containing protein [Candidatus Saccharibacteria bacterium]
MKNKLAIAAVVLILAGGVGAYTVNRDTQPTKTVQRSQAVAKQITSTADKKIVRYNGAVGQTALQTLQSLAKVDTKESSFGTMVVGINGVMAEEGKNYWAFYVDEVYANEGAGTYQNKSGDKIAWKLEDIKL